MPLINFKSIIKQWDISFDEEYIRLGNICSDIEGANPQKGSMIIRIPETSDGIEEIVVTHYYLGTYYPKNRYPDKYESDSFTQLVKQFKPFQGCLT